MTVMMKRMILMMTMRMWMRLMITIELSLAIFYTRWRRRMMANAKVSQAIFDTFSVHHEEEDDADGHL